jgi:hypothetical protein
VWPWSPLSIVRCGVVDLFHVLWDSGYEHLGVLFARRHVMRDLGERVPVSVPVKCGLSQLVISVTGFEAVF